MKIVRLALVSAALAGATTVGLAGTASAAHCADAGGPGNSDFAAHVRGASHQEGVTHKGWSTCQTTSANYTP